MWVCRYGTEPVRFMCISKMDGSGGAAGKAAEGRGDGARGAAYRPPTTGIMAAATPAPSDDKNAIIMAPE